MKKFVKSDIIPLNELTVSRKTTFQTILNQFTEFFDYPNPKKG